jgi:hypothetical protein
MKPRRESPLTRQDDRSSISFTFQAGTCFEPPLPVAILCCENSALRKSVENSIWLLARRRNRGGLPRAVSSWLIAINSSSNARVWQTLTVRAGSVYCLSVAAPRIAAS